MPETSAPRTQDTAGTLQQVDVYSLTDGKIQEAVVIGDGVANGRIAGMRADGYFNVRPDPTTLLFDTFETLDTANTWTLSGTVPPTGSGGNAVANPGTAANATSVARSQAAFTPGSSAFLQYAALVTVEAGVITGATRYWGQGVPAGSPTTTVPVANGSVFEVRAADGLLYGAVYSNGALTQSVALTRPTDGGVHRYQITYKASRVYFNIDNVEVASIAFPNPTVSALPVSFGTINGATALGTATNLTLTLVGVGDTGKNASQIADGTYPWRKATVSASGGLSIKGTSLVAQTGALAQATTGTIGPWAVNEANNATIFVKNTAAATAWTGAPVLVFEQSDDNVSWGPLVVARADTGVPSSTHTLPASTANGEFAFNTSVIGANWVRIRVTTGTTTGGITFLMDAGTMPFMPTVSLTGSLPAGTNTVGYVNPDVLVASTALSALNATVSVPLTGHGTVEIEMSGTFTATLSFEGLSADGTTWRAISASVNGGVVVFNTTSAAWARAGVNGFRQFRVRVTAYTSGTANVALNASYAPYALPVPDILQDAYTFADSRNSLQVMGRTAGSGSGTSSKVLIVDANGNLVMGAGTNLVGQVRVQTAATPTVTGVAGSATSVAVLAANANRVGASFQNDATSGTLYLREGATAATAASGGHTVQVAPGGYFEVPPGVTAAYQGIWSVAGGFVNVTERVT